MLYAEQITQRGSKRHGFLRGLSRSMQPIRARAKPNSTSSESQTLTSLQWVQAHASEETIHAASKAHKPRSMTV